MTESISDVQLEVGGWGWGGGQGLGWDWCNEAGCRRGEGLECRLLEGLKASRQGWRCKWMEAAQGRLSVLLCTHLHKLGGSGSARPCPFMLCAQSD